MALYLVQHGLSLSKDKDPKQGLSDTGIATTQRVAEVAKGYQLQVKAINHSAKKRAQQTAELMATALSPPGNVAERAGLLPLDDVGQLAPTLATADQLMLVGHLPFMERLTSLLVTGNPDNLVFKFQNSGIVCLDQDPENLSWFIKWTLMAKID
ncbi:MAG: phosphohistidine phosphatase SixA [Thermodesulfobacteriota bacterium]